MHTTATCGTCRHYDDIHNMCPLYKTNLTVGEVYLKRLPDSPACIKQYQSPVEECVMER
ncbi:hypothetical protein [Lyngbya confervoides]|uniref:Uncharacterized protein n=1 Tax=Lyngbya confervoides BDU141951 TaxID=1574623 RepID=A0ABD4T4T0_9CYAN|nr:hypothetical protein [Lyngbya confervoides]MCM1983585.1 hypothetical protein [Lyngbya confervoides BDU141951]